MSMHFTNYSYDVFLSFRGQDTRKSFTSKLYHALRSERIKTFFDDRIPKGSDGVLSFIFKAIEESKISVIVLSENYASSTLCLDELVKIMECMRKNYQFVLPIFYRVGLSDVRKQENSYAKAMDKHETRFGIDSKKVKDWRKALTEVADLPQANQYIGDEEYMPIKSIIESVSAGLFGHQLKHGDNSRTKISDLYPLHTWDESIQRQWTELFGIDKRCEHIELLVEKFQVVGIWGISGIGKTTIISIVFANLSSQFERHFFENVREESMKHGLNYLRDKLLNELVKREKILIVLDDVADSNQLEYLTRECDNYLEAGSRVIISTRDKNLLAGMRVDQIYEVKGLNFEEALQLYSLHALKQNSPEKAHEELSEKVVSYCKGNPLAIEVLGSFLQSKTTGEWESVLAEPEMTLNNDIQNVLRLSYNGLDPDHQEIFLYIACFLKGQSIDYVVDVLERCGVSASVRITTLVDRALITISYDNKVKMHELIQEMGQKIVGERCLAETPGLGHPEGKDLSNENGKTLAAEGLPSDVPQSIIEDLQLTTNTGKRMSTLRLLANSNWAQMLPEGPVNENDTKQSHAPIKEDIFDFRSSFVTMKVTEESELKELPPNLHTLRVEGCQRLESLPDQLTNKTSNVSELYAIDCPSLKYLVDGGTFISLTTLYTLGCKNLVLFPPSNNFNGLEHLCIGSSCDSLKGIILNHFPKLKTFVIWNCPNLESLSIIEKCGQRDLPLESLEIRDCPSLVYFQTIGSPTTKLVSLTLSNCVALESLPNGRALESLRTMFIDRCPKLNSLPEGGLLANLSLLSISFCDNLTPKKEWELNRLHFLTRFEIESVGENIESFPEKDFLPTNLVSLRISNLSSLTALDYGGLQQLTALQSLDINCCHLLSSFPDEGLPSSLISLSIQESPSLTQNLKLKLGAIAHVPNIKIDGDFISRKN